MGKQKDKNAKNIKKTKKKDVVRIRLIDGWSILWTSLLIIGLGGGILAMQLAGWLDNVIMSIVSVLLMAVLCTLVYDLGLLLTACVTIADGMINAGKDEQGTQLVFHTGNIEEIYLCDKHGQRVTEDRKRYTGVSLTFQMTSGRINRRAPRNYTQKQIDCIREAVK